MLAQQTVSNNANEKRIKATSLNKKKTTLIIIWREK